MSDTALAPDEVITDDFGASTWEGALSDNVSSSRYSGRDNLPDTIPEDLLEMPTDWKHLEEDPRDENYDPDETIEQATAREEREAQEAADKAAGKQPEDKPTDKVPAETAPAQDADVKAKVEAWDTFADMLQKNPDAVVKLAMERMSEAQKERLLETIGTAAPTAKSAPLPDLPEDYEPSEGMEEVLKARWSHIQAIPEMQKQIAEMSTGLDARMRESMRELHSPIGAAVVHAEIGLAKLDAICEALGLDLPTPDITELDKILNDGRTTVKSAVKRLTEAHYRKSLAEHKQSRAERPKTPGNQSTRSPKSDEPADMVQIMREMRGY
jgi:hypothetical protein